MEGSAVQCRCEGLISKSIVSGRYEMVAANHNFKTITMEKVQLKDLPFGSYFRCTEFGLIMRKAVIVVAGKIGAYNPFGDVFFYHANQLVIVVNQN